MPALPEDRTLAFRRTVANRVRTGLAANISEADSVLAIAHEQAAIARALATAAFAPAMAAAYAASMKSLGVTVGLPEAQQEIDSILSNRLADCKGFVQLLGQSDFIAAVRSDVAKPALPAAPFALSARKVEELVRRLVQPDDPAGAEPAVHVAASARGHQVTHCALALMFEPEHGNLRAPLVHALATAWPAATAQQIETVAATWLKARYEPAVSVAQGLSEQGDITREAMRRSEALQQQKLGHSSVPVPSALVTGPSVHAGRVNATPDLVMEV